MSAWLKRRAAVAAEARAEAEAHEASLRQAEAQALEARPDAELLAEAGLKEPEALVSAEEIRAFLKHALPDRLKRRALRRLWGLNPVLANVDGLVDYGEDFTDTAMCVENMQSLYTVGKGMLEQFRGLEDADEATEVALNQATAVDAEALASRTCSGTSVSDDETETNTEAPPDRVRGGQDQLRGELAEAGDAVPERVRDGGAQAGLPADAEDPAPLAPRHRRMRFTFERV